jgi:hypothetical protein
MIATLCALRNTVMDLEFLERPTSGGSWHQLVFRHSLYTNTFTLKKAELSLFLVNVSTTPCRHVGQWMGTSCSVDLSTSDKWAISFIPLLLYPQGKSPQHPLDKGLDGPQSLLDTVQKGAWPHWDSDSGPFVFQTVATHCTNPAVTS